MQQQIGFEHRRHRMTAHHRVAIDAESAALVPSEEMAEGSVAFQLRCTDDQGHGVSPNTRRPISIARPMLPTVGLELKVEQTL